MRNPDGCYKCRITGHAMFCGCDCHDPPEAPKEAPPGTIQNGHEFWLWHKGAIRKFLSDGTGEQQAFGGRWCPELNQLVGTFDGSRLRGIVTARDMVAKTFTVSVIRLDETEPPRQA